MARYQEVVERYEQMVPGHVNDTLDAIATALRVTDGELHRRTGISRPTINGMRAGRVRIAPEKLWPLASALDVEVDVLLMDEVHEAVCMALRGRQYDRASRRFALAGLGNDDRVEHTTRGESVKTPTGSCWISRKIRRYPSRHTHRSATPDAVRGTTQCRRSATGRRSLSATT